MQKCEVHITFFYSVCNKYLAPNHFAPKGLVAQLVELHTGVSLVPRLLPVFQH